MRVAVSRNSQSTENPEFRKINIKNPGDEISVREPKILKPVILIFDYGIREIICRVPNRHPQDSGL